jgi:arginyl-tRNA--protein-N-Asp/Glu arginylyltransferase
MRTIYHHTFGTQEQGEVYVNNAELVDVALHQFDQALSQGWLLTVKSNSPRWYQCRSTRCHLGLGQGNLLESYQAKVLHEPPMETMHKIHQAYCNYKGYKMYFEVNQHLPTDIFIGYYHIGKLVAWSKLRHYSQDSVETVQFVWDYQAPELRLGEVSLHHELAWARSQGYTRVYMGSGYERSNIYKSRVPGFEWWTGSQWSHDIVEYRNLCIRDSKITTVNQLYKL